MNNRLKEIFLSESLEHCNNILEASSNLLDINLRSQNLELIARYLHTIKGSSRMMGYKTFSNLIHAIEDKVKEAKSRDEIINESFVNFLKSITKKLIEILNSIDSYSDSDLNDLISQINNIKDFSSFYIQDKVEDNKHATEIIEKENIRSNIYKIHENDINALIQNLYSLLVNSEHIKNISNDFVTFFEDFLNKIKNNINFIENSKVKEILTNIVSDTYLNFTKKKLNLLENSQYLHNQADYCHKSALSFKMFEFKDIFDVIKNSTLEIAKELGKEIKFIIKGEDVKLDKDVLLKLQEPLIHILRNAVDHGIEKVSERIKNNKSPEGIIEIECISEGGNVKIVVKDDGRGIDIENIKKKADEIGIKTDKMADIEIAHLIFQPSFSTKRNVSDLSGRGEGLSIVKEVVNELGGRVDIDFEKGKFTKIILTVPVSFMEIDVLLFSYAGYQFAIFENLIERIEYLDEKRIFHSDNGTFYGFNGNNVKFQYTSDLLKCDNDSNNFIIFLNYRGNIFGITASNIFGIVKRRLYKYDDYIEKQAFFSHLIFETEDYFIPVLDVDYIFEQINKIVSIKKVAKVEITKRSKILLVEDSFATRELEKHILLANGFDVIEASNGKEALNIFNNRDDIDLIISDIEMPEMDGFTLTKSIRTGIQNPNIPIILVSTLSDKESIDMGLRAGANYFITKSEFSGEDFINKIKGLLGVKD